MSTQSSEWLNQNVLVDETRHGKAWHFDPMKQGDEPNHYPGEIPVADVERRLFPWEPLGLDVKMSIPDGTDVPKDVAESLVEQGFIIPDMKVWVRDDTFEVMGIHGEGYVGHGYKRWLLDQVAATLDDNLSIASAGLLDDGAKAWVEVSIPESITTPEGVEFRPLLLATTSLDGTIATTYKRVITLVVCDNTRAAALGESGSEFKVKHTRNSEARLLDSRNALDLVIATQGEYEQLVAKQTAQKVTARQFSEVLDQIVPMPEEDYAKRDDGSVVVLNKRAITMAERKRDSIIHLYNHDERVAPWKGTVFGVLQAFNTHEHHETRTNTGTIRLERNMLRTIKGEYDSLDRDLNKVLQGIL